MGWIKYVKSTARWRGVFSSINHEHERKEGNAEDWARTFSGESVWRRPRCDPFSCELCKFCPFPANGSAPHCITEHLYSSKWKKEQKRYRKGNIFHYSEGSRCKGIWCATNCAAKGQRDTVMFFFFFPPTPGFIVLTLQREWTAEIPSLKSHKMKSKKKFSCINKKKWLIYLFFMLLLVVVPGVVFLVVVQSLQLFFSSATSTLSRSAMWQLPLVKWSPVYSDCLPGEGQRREKAVDCVAGLVNPPQKASIWIVK